MLSLVTPIQAYKHWIVASISCAVIKNLVVSFQFFMRIPSETLAVYIYTYTMSLLTKLWAGFLESKNKIYNCDNRTWYCMDIAWKHAPELSLSSTWTLIGRGGARNMLGYRVYCLMRGKYGCRTQVQNQQYQRQLFHFSTSYA